YTCEFFDLEEKTSDFAPRWIIERYRTEYLNQQDELVARIITSNIRAERRGMKKKGKDVNLELPHPWSEEELAEIESEVLAEEIRGDSTRYWDDVVVGEAIPQLVKGPLTITDIIAWFAATVPLEAGSIALRHYRRRPGLAMIHPDTRAREMIEIVHFDREAARTVGLPYPYDLGAQRQSWLIQSLTHWAGDHGWLKRNSTQYRKFVYLSDVLWIRGKVTSKYIDGDGDHCVDIESSALN
ncbi:MAG: acyl dehydratase, partial [Dehalococcoidia bacterium]|nr:acyl dehydratase [Dehalococcoidia bacterium]